MKIQKILLSTLRNVRSSFQAKGSFTPKVVCSEDMLREKTSERGLLAYFLVEKYFFRPYLDVIWRLTSWAV